jgi:hypothetical protein
MATSRAERLNAEIKPDQNIDQSITQEQTNAEASAQEKEADATAEGIPGAPTAAEFEQMKNAKHPFDLGALDNLDETTGEDLTGEILSSKMFDDGESKAFYFTGFSSIPDKLTAEERKAAVLVNKQGTFFCPSFVIVQALEKVDQSTLPRAVRITSEGMKEGKNNKYWNARVTIH